MKIDGIEFQIEDDSLWITWYNLDGRKLYNSDVKKLLRWLKKNFETPKPKEKQ